MSEAAVRGSRMPAGLRWALGVAVVLAVGVPPVVLYRAQYGTAKRFREVTPGRFYRSGQMTAGGLREVITRYGIRTVINLQHEDPDPHMPDRWLGPRRLRESEVCEAAGAKYLLLTPDILPEPNSVEKRPEVLDAYLAVLDEDDAYPVLIHCKAGLHRTGRLTAIYRMEYEGWSVGEAMRELRANGYGFTMSSDADPYIVQFVQNYKVRPNGTAHAGGGQRP